MPATGTPKSGRAADAPPPRVDARSSRCAGSAELIRRDLLEHAIRAACQIIGHREVIVVGSQAILGSIPDQELPAAATMSLEVDMLPIATDTMRRLASRT